MLLMYFQHSSLDKTCGTKSKPREEEKAATEENICVAFLFIRRQAVLLFTVKEWRQGHLLSLLLHNSFFSQ